MNTNRPLSDIIVAAPTCATSPARQSSVPSVARTNAIVKRFAKYVKDEQGEGNEVSLVGLFELLKMAAEDQVNRNGL